MRGPFQVRQFFFPPPYPRTVGQAAHLHGPGVQHESVSVSAGGGGGDGGGCHLRSTHVESRATLQRAVKSVVVAVVRT